MYWPNAGDYNEAVQNLHSQVADEELRTGEVERTLLGLPSTYSGNFADVYKVYCPHTKNSWAIKCFTRPVTGLQERYRLISKCLNKLRLPFMVDFKYLEQGIRIRGNWYPILKMKWVEGQTLNKFIEQSLDRPKLLHQIGDHWVRLASRLNQAGIAHADLQHGNVLLVPVPETNQLRLSLIDYDGMFVPQLAGRPSGELGHPSFQHPQRTRDRVYTSEVDRFSHLVIYTATKCLTVGGRSLWNRFNNCENLLFTEVDFKKPAESKLFRELWNLPGSNVRDVVGHLLLATQQPIASVPLLSDLVQDGQARPLSGEELNHATALLNGLPPGSRLSIKPSLTPFAPSVPKSALSASESMPVVVDPKQLFAQSASAAPQSPVASQPIPITNAGPSAPIPISISPTTPKPRQQPSATLSLLTKIAAAIPRRFTARTALISFFVNFLAMLAIGLFVLPGKQPDSPSDQEQNSPLPESPPTEEPSVKPLSKAPTTSTPVVLPVAGSLQAPFDEPTAKSMKAAWAASLKQPLITTNSVGMRLTIIPPGKFMMGSPASEKGRKINERQVEVALSRPFYLGITEVTQAQWKAVMGTEPWKSHYSLKENGNYPATNMQQADVQAFCDRLSAKEGKTYRLPTEAEWEYACRAGTTTAYYFGDEAEAGQWQTTEIEINGQKVIKRSWVDANLLRENAWFNDNSLRSLLPVATRNPNPFGLHDMYGNASERCQDMYVAGLPGGTDPRSALSSGGLQAIRGGNFSNSPEQLRSAARSTSALTKEVECGFRVALEISLLPPNPGPLSATTASWETVKLVGMTDRQSIPNSWMGTWSPDGSQVAYTSHPDRKMYIRDVPSGKTRLLVNDGKDGRWSPGQGKWVAFVRGEYDKEELWVIEANGNNLRKVADGGYPQWLDDGKTVTFRASLGGMKILAADVSQATAPRLLFAKPSLSFYPAVSPDGKHVAYQLGPNLIVDRVTDQSTLVSLPIPNWYGFLPVWSRDSKYFTFGGYASGGVEELRIVDISSQTTSILAAGKYTLGEISPDGKKIVYDHRNGAEFTVRIADLNLSTVADTTGK